MIFREKKEVNGWFILEYSTTWRYGYDFMLDAAQTLIDVDFRENLERIATAEIIGGKDVEQLKEVVEAGYILKNCDSMNKECGALTIAGQSQTMSCPIQICFFNQTNALRLFCPKKEMFEEYGDHVFDNYLNSIEIKAYCRDAKRKAIEAMQDV